MTCDGTETICLSLTDEAQAAAAGAVNQGGNFAEGGYAPDNQGGLDWAFGSSTDLSSGKLEVDVTGLLPTEGDEGSGGKVSIFDMCATNGEADYLGLQKMTWDYHDGHNFRYGFDDDELADNWDEVIITSADLGCYYTIADWTADQTHHLIATWSPDALYLTMDGTECHSWGNGDRFDASDKLFVLGNRCQHYDNQQPLARLSNFRFWALGDGSSGGGDTGDDDSTDDEGFEDTGTPPTDGGGDTPTPCVPELAVDPTYGSGTTGHFTATYQNCSALREATTLRFAVADQAGGTGVLVEYAGGALAYGGATCLSGTETTLASDNGTLDCASSFVALDNDDAVMVLNFSFNPTAFSGSHQIWLGVTGGSAETADTAVGRFVVQSDTDDNPGDTSLISGSCAGSGLVGLAGFSLSAAIRRRKPSLTRWRRKSF